MPDLPLLCLATRSRDKVRELTPLLTPFWDIRSSADFPDLVEEIEETGDSFLANATLKAITTSQAIPDGTFVLADDSGIEVDALEGAPGIFSARYGGIPSSSARNNAKLQQELARVQAKTPQERSARYCCVLALAQGGEFISSFSGECRGTIALEERGINGFGYDPLFIPQGCVETFGELPNEKKEEISHRAEAVRQFIEWSRRQREDAAE